MPAWWARHAWLGGSRTAPDVLLEVKEGRFVAVTPGVTHPPRGAIRLEGLTLPGLVNVHSHAFHRALRGRTHETLGSFWTWRDLMYEVAAKLDPDSYRRLAGAVFAEMALAGFTTVGEFHYLHHRVGGARYDDPNAMGAAVMEAATGAGIRLTLLDACYLEGGFDAPLEGPQLRFGDGDADGWIERVSQLVPGPMTRIGAAVHSARAVSPVAIQQVAAWVGERGWPLHAHVSEQLREHNDCRKHRGTTPLGLMAAAGAVTARFTAVHGTHLSKKDIAGLAGAGGGCCACPTTERDLGDGIGPFAALQQAGVALSIGSDSHAVIDGFEEARAIEMDARLATQERGILPAATLLEAATVNGAAALGWHAGSLAAGRLADFVTVRLDSARTAGADPTLAATAVFAASAADVTEVVVGGRPVVSGGVHRSLPDFAGELTATVAALFPVTSLAITGIGALVTCDPAIGPGPLGTVTNGALVIDDGVVGYAGPAGGAPSGADYHLDVAGRAVMPGFVDSHTHLIFGGDRAAEFAQRMAGRSYRPGGILDTVAATRAASIDVLAARARHLVDEAAASGTTTIEIKTGYGLTLEHEAAHLHLAGQLTAETTFLGAHLVPPEFGDDRPGYLRLLTDRMIPAAARQARWCDVFCEAGAFDATESRAVLESARAHGMGLRVHANQLGPGPGVRLACELGAASADHCTHLSSADVDDLAASTTVATLLPISDFCTRQPYPDGRRLIDSGVTVALASNCNPGSSYSTSMPLALALAVRECGLSIDEAVWAATRGGAAALRRSDIGRLSPGAGADAIVLDAPDPTHLVYRLGTSLAWAVLKDGAWAIAPPTIRHAI